jgi:hypothetical protein
MKALFLTLLLLCSNAFAALTDVKFGRYQIADSQWNVNACLNTTTCQIYSKQPGVAYKIPWSNGQVVWATGDYVKFDLSGNGSFPYTAKQYDSAGNVKSTLGNGKIVNMGPDYFFFVGSDNNTGQLFSGSSGMANTSGVSWTGTLNPTIAQANGYADAGYSTTPLAAGQTASPPAPPPPNWQPIRTTSSPVVINNIFPTSNNSPGGEGATQAFDGNAGTKYLNFDKKNAGVTVKLSQGRVVQKFTLTTANDFSGRDPTSYKLYGSNDGVNWILIKQDTLSLSEQRFWTSPEIMVANTNAYVYYFILFPTTKSGDGCGLNCDSMQIAEITFYYDLNDGVTSTASGSGGTPNNPGTVGSVCADCGPTVVGGTITQTNAPSTQTIQSGGTYVNNSNRAAQQTRINTWVNSASPYSNAVHVDQISGDNNNVTINVTGTKNRVELTLDGAGTNTIGITQVGSNYLTADVNGYQNNLTSSQTNTIGTNYTETTINGNNNTANHTQSNSQLLFSTVSGNSNTLVTSQTGTGQHYLDVKMTGNGHNVNVNQFGSAANNARIDVTNAGGAATVDLDQNGGKNFTLIQSCGIASGCSTVVNQQ